MSPFARGGVSGDDKTMARPVGAQALRAIPTLDALRRLLPTGRKNFAEGRFSPGGNCILPI